MALTAPPSQGGDPSSVFPSIANAPPWLQQMLMAMLGINPAEAADDPQGVALRAAAAAQASGTPQPQNPALAGAGAISTGGVPNTPPLQASMQPRAAPPNAPPGPPPQPAYNPLSGGSANTGRPAGYGPPPQPAYNPLSGGSANTGQPPDNGGVANVSPGTGPMGPFLPRKQGAPNMGYYGVTQYQNPNSLRNAPFITTRQFGGGQPPGVGAPQGSPSSTPQVAGGRSWPGGQGWTFDAQGNPIPAYT